MTRIRSNFQRGTITDNPLLIGDTTVNSAEFDTLPVVTAPDVLIAILDPEGTAGLPEIVIITAHTAAATSVTALRGQEGSTAREHASGIAWRHGPTVTDFLRPTINEILWTPNTGSVLNDEFNDSSLDAAWIQTVPSGTQTIVEGADILSVKVKANTAAHCCALLKPMGTFAIGNYIETAVRYLSMQAYLMAGILIAAGTLTTSASVWMRTYRNGTVQLFSFRNGTLTTEAAAVDIVCSSTVPVIYQRVTWVAANTWKFEWSGDGVGWSDFGQGNKTYTVAPTHIGLGTGTWGGVQDSLATYEYFRVGP